jgi:hypothetical protein
MLAAAAGGEEGVGDAGVDMIIGLEGLGGGAFLTEEVSRRLPSSDEQE